MRLLACNRHFLLHLIFACNLLWGGGPETGRLVSVFMCAAPSSHIYTPPVHQIEASRFMIQVFTRKQILPFQ